MKKRDLSLDVIRILAILMIVMFHFASLWGDKGPSFMLFHKNGTYGSLGTALFFILSGYLMRKKYKQIGSIASFYKKRFISIFPPFYIAFIVAYIIMVIVKGSLFYQGKPYALLFTLFGVDSLVQWYNLPSYALVGEWFTGIIIILYLLFPIFNKLMKLNKWTVTVVYFIFYVLYINYEWFPVISDISIVACGFVFWLGMLIAEYSDDLRLSYITGILAAAASLLLLFVFVLPIQNLFANHLMAVLIFISMLVLLKDLTVHGKTFKGIVFLSEVSYCVYLTHHFIITSFYGFLTKMGLWINFPFWAGLVISMVMVMIASLVLFFATKALLKALTCKKKQ